MGYVLVVIDWSFDMDLVRTSKTLNQWLVASAVTSENNGRSKSAEERISVLLSAGDPISAKETSSIIFYTFTASFPFTFFLPVVFIFI